MKIPLSDIHPSLRQSARGMKVLNFLCSRRWGLRIVHRSFASKKGKQFPGLFNDERFIKCSQGGEYIRLRIFKPLAVKEKLPVMLYMHGGGYSVGVPEQNERFISGIIQKRPCIIVAVDYRKSLTDPYPAGFNDCYDTLLWIRDNMPLLHGLDDNIIVAGHSAGGGLAAAVALKARDTGEVNIAFQMPIYPMIDNLQENESSKFISPIWDANTNKLGWSLYLAGLKSSEDSIPIYAAPARNIDFNDLPPTITFVGDIEPFRDETIQFVEALEKQQIPCQFKLFKGCFHGFDHGVPKASISKEARQFILDSYAMYYDKFLNQN